MFLQRITYSFVLLTFLNSNVLGQSLDFPFENIGKIQGLSGPVKSICADHLGFMYFATDEGLARFDGQRIRFYQTKIGDSTTINNNIVNDISVDAKNRIWIASNGGLCYFDHLTDQIHRLNLPDTLESIDQFRIHNLFVDYQDRIWFATRTAVHVLNTNFSVQASYKLPDRFGSMISEFHIDKDDQLWIGTNTSYLIQWDLCSRIINDTKISSPASSQQKSTTTLRTLKPDPSGQLIAGSWMGGLNRIHYNGDQLHSIHYENNLDNNFRNNIVCAVAFANDSCWWVGTFGSGIYLYNPKTTKYFRHILHTPANPFSLSGNYVQDIYKDKNGAIWVGTENGVSIYHPAAHPFSSIKIPDFGKEYSIYRNPSQILEFNDINSTAHYLILIPGLGLIQFNRQSKNFSGFFQGSSKDHCINPDRVYQILPFRNEYLMLGDHALYTLNLTNRSCSELTLPAEIKLENARKFIIDKRKYLWIISSSSGLYMIDSSLSQIKHYKCDPLQSNGIQDNVLTSIMEDSRGNIWLGTQNRGLSVYHISSDRFTHFQHSKSNPQSIPDNNIFDLEEDATGNVWASTENGLVRFSSDLSKIKIFSTIEGLPNNTIRNITKDLENNLWFSTINGLARLDFKKGSFQSFYQRDGLAENNMNGAGFQSSDGELIFSGNSVLSWCQIKNRLINSIVPVPRITSISIDGQRIPLLREGNTIKDIHLKYGQNNLFFEFAGLPSLNSSKNTFSHFLKGYDAEWIFDGTQNMAMYANLNGGKYTFLLKVQNENGLSASAMDSVDIIIQPPFWESWWFITVVILSVCAFTYYVFQMKLRQWMRLQQLRIDIARDLHDEVGSSLSSIKLTSQKQASSGRSEQSYELAMERIQSAANSAMDMMNEIIWSLQPENDNISSLFNRIRRFAVDILEAAQIPFKLEISEKAYNCNISIDKRKDVLLIIKEALNNCAKYSKATFVQINIDVSPGEMSLLIRDNGTGFLLNNTEAGNGLKNMKVRAQSINAQLLIQSSPGSGTSIQLLLPLIT